MSEDVGVCGGDRCGVSDPTSRLFDVPHGRKASLWQVSTPPSRQPQHRPHPVKHTMHFSVSLTSLRRVVMVTEPVVKTAKCCCRVSVDRGIRLY